MTGGREGGRGGGREGGMGGGRETWRETGRERGKGEATVGLHVHVDCILGISIVIFPIQFHMYIHHI